MPGKTIDEGKFAYTQGPNPDPYEADYIFSVVRRNGIWIASLSCYDNGLEHIRIADELINKFAADRGLIRAEDIANALYAYKSRIIGFIVFQTEIGDCPCLHTCVCDHEGTTSIYYADDDNIFDMTDVEEEEAEED